MYEGILISILCGHEKPMTWKSTSWKDLVEMSESSQGGEGCEGRGSEHMCAHVLSCFTCVRLCNPRDCSPPGSSVGWILQARVLEWVAMPSSRDLLNPGSERGSLPLQEDSLPLVPTGKPSEYEGLPKRYP